jgi:hypothetical protein
MHWLTELLELIYNPQEGRSILSAPGTQVPKSVRGTLFPHVPGALLCCVDRAQPEEYHA